MAVPKRRTSHARKGKRRSHQFVTPRQNAYCDRCGEPVLPHIVCGQCGWSNIQNRELITASKTKED